ncbi:hypothetical protein FA95DRAFT_1418521 [Auriscalpium vulgare]|uniref:Uncharacterized protein n=1 Tax=Auriscalpium vulgare TaxID=40419 RepID=A0ACB8RR36_9AGAM|nr:hypothetical protein FA95DRAFT_1418521 [Auriscalpium vulgare]
MAFALYARMHPKTASFPAPWCGRRFFMASRVLNRLPPYKIQTLDPSKLLPSDFVDLSGRAQVNYTARLADDRQIRKVKALYYAYITGDGSRFPPDTRGFLYFHAPSREVRFRLASNDPRRFAEGRDLARPSGEPWCVRGSVLAKRSRASGLHALLVQDGLLTEKQVAQLAESTAHSAQFFEHREHIRRVTRLGETFSVSFALRRMNLLVGPSADMEIVRWWSPFRWSLQTQDSGHALLSFERSPLSEHRGRRVLVLLVHQVSEEPQVLPERQAFPEYKPEKGKLVYRPGDWRKPGRPPKPWSYSLDTKSRQFSRAHKALLHLWDHGLVADNERDV